MGSLVEVSTWWGNLVTACQAAGPPSPSWGCIREWTGSWRNHVTHSKHLKEMAPQELPTHHPLPQVTLLFSDMGRATEGGTALLAVRPAQRNDVVGKRVQSPP